MTERKEVLDYGMEGGSAVAGFLEECLPVHFTGIPSK